VRPAAFSDRYLNSAWQRYTAFHGPFGGQQFGKRLGVFDLAHLELDNDTFAAGG
jgi:hypothetical protein